MDFDLIELLEVRKIIEPQAAGLAAGWATPEELRDIKDHLVKLIENVDIISVREQQDFLFHDAVVRASGNRILRALFDSLTPILVKSRRVTGPSHHDTARIVQQHTAIYEAIRIGNADLAQEGMPAPSSGCWDRPDLKTCSLTARQGDQLNIQIIRSIARAATLLTFGLTTIIIGPTN